MIYISKNIEHTNFKELIFNGFYKREKPLFDNEPDFDKTYHDEECILLQCNYASRSFEDLLELCQTYYPETTKQELAHYLVVEADYIKSLYCRDISKVVFYIIDNPCDDYEFNTFYADHFEEMPHKRGIGQYSMDDILSLSEEFKTVFAIKD